ncbi:MAG: HK97 family phage prohead protease [Oscillospiraceae bacterium]|nr:HK97 family phage prohead protease [Oscillospiraceae bacterium]
MQTDRTIRQVRSVASSFETRSDDTGMYIEGYFSVFNSNYEIYPGCTESVAPGAFSNTLGGDIKALCDHDTRLVLGRNKAGTLELREDSHGLWGRITINPNDSDAVNLYERVKRGDVDQCSFGFDIREEEADFRDDGSVHFTIRDVVLYEVSVVTFPAYAETSVSARKQDVAEIQKRKLDAWKISTRARLKGEKHGTESTDAEAQD